MQPMWVNTQNKKGTWCYPVAQINSHAPDHVNQNLTKYNADGQPREHGKRFLLSLPDSASLDDLSNVAQLPEIISVCHGSHQQLFRIVPRLPGRVLHQHYFR